MAGKKQIFDFSLFSRVYSFVKPYKRWFYLSIILGIVMAAFAPVRPYLIQVTINAASGKDKTIPEIVNWLTLNSLESNIVRFIFAVFIFQLLFIIIETVVRFFFAFIASKLGQFVVKDLRVAVYKQVMRLNLRQFDRTPIGTLTTRTVSDIESINEIFSDGLIPIIADFLTIIIVLITMFVTDWQLALISLIPFPFLLIATYFFKESVNKSFIKVRNAITALNAFVQEHITGMHIVQAFAAEEREYDKFKKINKQHRDANIKAIFAYSVFFPIVEIVLAISTGLLVWWIADRNIDGGVLVAFILYLNLLFRPLRIIADKFNVIQMGMVAAERVFKLMDNDDVMKDEGTYDAKIMQGAVRFNDVWFAYNNENWVLKNVTFNVKPGETIALVGHTGSGKTSIISLINRLYNIQKGEIKIDYRNIDEYTLQNLRTHIGVVLQDVFLFSGSIMDNITLRNNSITQEQVETAAKLIGMHDFIMQLPGGYDYNVMERGATLSLGQRQLISFIRALIYNPSILILDEATSSIDTESERLIQYAIDKMIKGRTAIVIAHRLSTIRKADKIIVLDKGEIKEMGKHEELLSQNGYYSKLYSSQMQKSLA